MTQDNLIEELFDKTITQFYECIFLWINSNRRIQFDDVNSLFKTMYTRNCKTILNPEFYKALGRHAILKVSYNFTSNEFNLTEIKCFVPSHIQHRSERMRNIYMIFNTLNPEKISNHKKNVYSIIPITELEKISFQSINNLKF